MDYLELGFYKDVNLDKDPVIVPSCGHAILMSSLDGNVDMSSVYEMNPDGTVQAIKTVEPFSKELKDFPGCPICRGSLRGINRYARLVRRVLLDESTKRFVTSAGAAYGPLTERLYAAQEKLSTAPSLEIRLGLPKFLRITGSRNEQYDTICEHTVASNRFVDLINAREAIARYYARVNKDATPFSRIWNLVEAARRRTGRTDVADLRSPVSQVTFHIMALALLIRCDISLLADVINEFRKVNKPIGVKIDVNLWSNREECDKLVEDALKAKDYERAVEGHIFFARYCAIEIPFIGTPAAALELKNKGTAHIDAAHALCNEHGGKLNSLVSEVKDVERSLAGGTFMQEVSSEERRAVLAAMAKEFRGTGHWYTCINGHPFTVGECGMPMQMAKCPQCGEGIGGTNHRPTDGVSRADDLEAELARMHLD